MSRSLKLWLFTLLLAFFSRGALAEDLLTLKQVADLYLKVFINYDIAGTRVLNNYYQDPSAADPAHTFNPDAAGKVPEMVKEIHVSAFQGMFDPVIWPQLKPDAEQLATALVKAQRRAQCNVTGSRISTNEGQRVANIRFVCAVTDTRPLGKLIRQFDANTGNAKFLARFLPRFSEALKSTAVRTVRGSMGLRESEKEGQKRWINDSPVALADTVHDALWLVEKSPDKTGQRARCPQRCSR